MAAKKKSARKKAPQKKLGDVHQLFNAAQAAVENGEKVIRSLGVLERLIRGRTEGPRKLRELEKENDALRLQNEAMTKFISALLHEARDTVAFTKGKPILNFEIVELGHNIMAVKVK
jgi:hypothetical protein